ncbi:sigma-70 family RNA polymerase sigma factor [Caulobacter sp. 17J65-9]|uniref:sigma-70 family RNA polymerase sigma factor n=1 Tax=Caulobacter sp. 17J65-9 TaxID=2709382 RepID=UPI0013C85D6D|nr:sigma-70 family RNA polymerase sigma factor [Caulobacter sp. 17J65-9]NEX95178.1 sigma-70 family RNA polymerase sigma factor [Caulobacter sp. 17J65-9]
MRSLPASDETFRDGLTALIPQLRAFARTLCRNRAEADDLAQDALLKAWNARERFEAGTNLKAWAFMILRNQFYSDRRRAWRSCALDPEQAERTLVAASAPDAGLELDELRRALALLPDEQRESLILVGAGGFSYEEVGEICGVATGTIKSRVSRARTRVEQILAEGAFGEDDVPPDLAMDVILAQLSKLTHGAWAA